MPFAQPSELSTWVGYDVPTDRATLMLEVASASVVDAAGVPIAEQADDEVTLDGNGARVLLLPAWPVTDVASVEVDGSAVTDFTWTRAGELRRTAGWTARTVVVVTYTHGYPANEVPTTIKGVTLEVAARAMANPQYMRAFQTDGTNAQFSDVVMDLTDGERDRVLRALG